MSTYDFSAYSTSGIHVEITGWITSPNVTTSWAEQQFFYKDRVTGFKMGGLFRWKVGPTSFTPPTWTTVPNFNFTYGIASSFSFTAYVTSFANPTVYVSSGVYPAGITISSSAQTINAASSVPISTYANLQILATDLNNQTSISNAFSAIVSIGQNPPIWDTTTFFSVQAGGVYNLNTICTDLDLGDSITYSPLLTLPNGVSLNTTSGALSVGSTVSTGAYSLRFRATDTTLRSADSQILTMSVPAAPTQINVTMPQDEMWSVAQGPGSLPVPSGGLWPTSYVFNGLPTGVSNPTFNGNVYGVVSVGLSASTGSYTFNVTRSLNDGSSTQYQYNLTVIPALVTSVATGFEILRTGVWYRNLASLMNSGQLQSGDTIVGFPRSGGYASPDSAKYCVVLQLPNNSQGSVSMVSATPGQKVVIDCTNSILGLQSNWQSPLVPNGHNTGTGQGIITWDAANNGMKTFNMTDYSLLGPGPSPGDASCALYIKGPSAGAVQPWTISISSCVFAGMSNGVRGSPNEIGTANYSTVAGHSVAFTNCEFYGNGADGTAHNLYMGHFSTFSFTGCYSHSMAGDGHLLKTKAMKNTVLYSRFTDESGFSSFLNDFSIAGDVLVQGCIYEQSQSSAILSERPVVSVGREWKFWSTTDARVTAFKAYQNTLVSYGLSSPIYFDFGVTTSNALIPLTTTDIQDNVLGGKNTPTATGSTVVFATESGTVQKYASVISSNNAIAATVIGDFPSVFTNPGGYDFSLITPVAGTGAEAKATSSYTFQVGVQARSDTSKGAYATGLPFWASAARIQSGTWYEIGSSAGGNVASDLDATALTNISGQYTPWLSFNPSPAGSVFWQWNGGVYASGYCPGGAMIFWGGGHPTTDNNNRNNSVVAWRSDTAQFEYTALPWFDINQILPGPGVTGGNTSATLEWVTGAQQPGHIWQNNQTNSSLAAHGENTFGVPAAGHCYNALGYMLPVTGLPKGALLLPEVHAMGTDGSGGSIFPHFCDLNAGPNAQSQVAWQRYSEYPFAGYNFAQPICATCYSPRSSIAYSISGPSAGRINIYNMTAGAGSQTATSCGISGMTLFGHNGAQFEYCQHSSDPNQDILYCFTADSPQHRVVMWVSSITAGGTVTPKRTSETNYPGLSSIYSGFAYCADTDSIYMLDIGSSSGVHQGFTSAAGISLWRMQFPSDRWNGNYNWTQEILTRSSYQSTQANNPRDFVFQSDSPPTVGMFNKLRYNPVAKVLMYAHQSGMPMRVFKGSGM